MADTPAPANKAQPSTATRSKPPEGIRRYTPKEALTEAARRMAAQTPKPRKRRNTRSN